MIKKAFSLLPLWLGKIPYDLSFRLAQSLLRSKHCQIWTRNSYAEGLLLPGYSDIDLSFFHSKTSSSREIKRSLRCYRKWKNLFPLWGEVNSYKEDEIEDFLPFMNTLEFLRDEGLQKLFPHKNRYPSPEERITFLLRMLLADRHNLKRHPELREKKWRAHCEKTGVTYATHPLDNIYSCLLSSYQIPKKILEDFLLLDEKETATIDAFYLGLTKEERRSFILIYALRWLVVSLRNHEFEQDLELILSFGPSEKKLLWTQISWEIWGIYSQYHSLALTEDLSLHLENIARILTPFPETLPLQEGVQRLKRLCQNYRQE